MSKQLINQYYNDLHNIRLAGESNEGAISGPFYILAHAYAKKKRYDFIQQVTIKSRRTGENIRPDGILRSSLRTERGYWESKDTKDNLDIEINKKINDKGYPTSNIIFEDSQTAVLFQEGDEIMRVSMKNPEELDRILTAFIDYRPREVEEFEEALQRFQDDIPAIVGAFRELFDRQIRTNKKYLQARDKFLDICKQGVNPEVTAEDVREMAIQHILTEDLFKSIFGDTDFLKFNTIAKELENVIESVLTREVRYEEMAEIRHYYQALRARAASIAEFREKQNFLKEVYENFYKAYNPKGADRLGVVYTPNEIVSFMIDGVNFLLDKHFNKELSDKGVKILDPATGTGTFVTELLNKLPMKDEDEFLEKYQTEIFANEVSILPYYIANLNIEYTFHRRTNKYKQFENICFVDTLDNLGYFQKKRPEMVNKYAESGNLFAVSTENTERIKHQNAQEISVIIGNPPYNANQQNFNDFNKNREYKFIDDVIKSTFVKESTAQKTKVYDMYARFYRWAMDRVNENQGIIAYITNRSFIDSRTFDGFRKIIQQDFQHAYIIDTKSDVRANPKIAGTTHNVFGIQTGVAIMFLVKKNDDNRDQCKIRYTDLPDEMLKGDKLQWFADNPLQNISFTTIQPSKKNNWINLANNDFEELILVGNKDVKSGKSNEGIFKLIVNGVATSKDDWVYDFSSKNLTKKISFYSDFYNDLVKRSDDSFPSTIKWSDDLKYQFKRKKIILFDKKKIITAFYRPFVKKYYYVEQIISDRLTNLHFETFGSECNGDNLCIGFIGLNTEVPFSVLCFNNLHDYNSLSNAAAGNKAFPLYRYDSEGTRHDNLTDWGLDQFRSHYKDDSITKESIFHYTYSVLHHPAYRSKYALNLKREFPRLPYYADFWQWSKWGKQLMDLHLNYETAVPTTLAVASVQTTSAVSETAKPVSTAVPKPKLKADKAANTITLDTHTTLTGIPALAWEYKLGNRSALEWILDQYKEKKPRDATIAEHFNTYRFADYKEEVIDLLCRVCTVSVKTMEIINEMPDGGDG